jgi:hypothetical protein
MLHCMSPVVAQSAASNRAEQCPLCPDTSDFDLLSDGKRIIDLDSEISDGTFHFLVGKQKLDRTQVGGATVDQGRLRAAERVRGKDVRVQSDARDPFCDEPRVLPCLSWPHQPAGGCTVRQRKTGRLVRFELTEQTRQAVLNYGSFREWCRHRLGLGTEKGRCLMTQTRQVRPRFNPLQRRDGCGIFWAAF